MILRLIAATFLCAALLSSLASAQDENVARDLFKTYTGAGPKGKPGAIIRIELMRNGNRSFVSPDAVFRAGDKVKLHFQVNFPAYVEIYNRGSSGRLERLFPYVEAGAPIKLRTGYVVPNRSDEWFEFDQTPGTEQLSFIFSERLITRPTTQKKPVKIYQPGVIVNQGSQPKDEKQLAIDELNNRALEEGRDLKRVKTQSEQYVFSEPQRLRRILGVLLTLQHK